MYLARYTSVFDIVQCVNFDLPLSFRLAPRSLCISLCDTDYRLNLVYAFLRLMFSGLNYCMSVVTNVSAMPIGP